MSESTRYIKFFTRYKYFIIIPVILVVILTTIYEVYKPATFEYQAVYEYQYEPSRVEADVILTEQLVGNLRERYGVTYGEDNSKKSANLNFYRSTPLTVNFIATSTKKDLSEKAFKKISGELKSNYPLTVLVEERQSVKSNFNLLEIVAAIIGTLFIMIFFTTLFDYLRQH